MKKTAMIFYTVPSKMYGRMMEMKFDYPESVEQWGILEISLEGRSDGNPFTDYSVTGDFYGKNEVKRAEGFYDGDGIYKVRFMPSFPGEYTFVISGTGFDGTAEGKFEVFPASDKNHGPVRVFNTFHFAYADGTPYYPVGTTCYAWTHQPEETQEKTLRTLEQGYFNKIRFCVFPKHYDFNFADPVTFPYEGTPCDNSSITQENFGSYKPDNPENHWDFTRFCPEHFRGMERRIRLLMDLGIEADIIVMHPYDRWGFSEMSAEDDDRYVHYLIARFAAFRNVWWSLANEYDLMKKSIADWERIASIFCEYDPYCRLRSIHNCHAFYDYTAPWITHCCIQRQDDYKCAELTGEYRARYRKPVVLDEIAYEGNLPHGWGNISGKELVRRFWESAVRGGYAGHGETYLSGGGNIWWSHGGELHGESQERIRFLHSILQKTPGLGLKPVDLHWDGASAAAENGDFYYLIYFGFHRPSYREYDFGPEPYTVEVIDTWEMTSAVLGTFRGKVRIPLPGKEYMALRICRPD